MITTTKKEFNKIKKLASTRKNKNLNTIYTLNRCEFKIMQTHNFKKDSVALLATIL